MKEKSLGEGELFVSDLGAERYESFREKVANLKRYAVIRNNGVMEQLKLLEVGDDLEYLMTKYSIERGNVGRIADERGKSSKQDTECSPAGIPSGIGWAYLLKYEKNILFKKFSDKIVCLNIPCNSHLSMIP